MSGISGHSPDVGTGPFRPRVLRGGSWANNNERNARCSYRNNDHPANFNDNNGFRVVVSDRFPQRASSAAHREMGGRCPHELRERAGPVPGWSVGPVPASAQYRTRPGPCGRL
ncbi:MAG: hypothetical protein FJ026_13145 [Chloroflexi bacterium]|nr:hypothetical protein [Chloroflexota bacterium]